MSDEERKEVGARLDYHRKRGAYLADIELLIRNYFELLEKAPLPDRELRMYAFDEVKKISELDEGDQDPTVSVLWALHEATYQAYWNRATNAA